MKSTHDMKYLGRLEFLKPLQDLTPGERERLADLLSGYAADIRKGAVLGCPWVDFYVVEGE